MPSPIPYGEPHTLKAAKLNWRINFENELQKAERTQIRAFQNYFNSEYAKGFETFIMNGQMNFDGLFREKDLMNLYEELYESIGIRFAKWYSKNFDSLIEKQQDVSGFDLVWRQVFRAEGLMVAGSRVSLVSGAKKKTLHRVITALMSDAEFQSQGAEVKARIFRNKFEGYSRNEAIRLVRTESTNAANQATMVTAKDMFGAEGLEKEWITAVDGRERAAHRAANGQIVDFNEPFIVDGQELQRPGDPNGSASNVINCRCSVAPFPKEEIQEVDNRRVQVDPVRVDRGVEVDFSKMKKVEIESYLKDVLEANSIKVSGVNTKGITQTNLRLLMPQIKKLLDEYNVSSDLNVNTNGVLFKFSSGKRTLGSVTRVSYDRDIMRGNLERGYLKEVNFGSAKSGSHRTSLVDYKFDDSAYKFERWNSFVDTDKQHLSTATHEFAHFVTTKDSQRTIDFWREFDVLKTKYFDELRQYEYADWTQVEVGGRMRLTKIKDLRKYDEIAIGKYAHTNSDELLAEAFAEYKLSSNPRKYAKLIGELFDKYFKK